MLRRPTTWSAWINIGNGKGSSPFGNRLIICRQAEPVTWRSEPQINKSKSIYCRGLVICAKFWSHSYQRFSFYTHPHTHPHICTVHHDKVIGVPTPPYYVCLGANNNNNNNKCVRKAATICPAPASWPLTFWPWTWCPSHVWRGLPLCQF